MARNGSGTFVTPNTFVAGTTITAASHNENWSDAASEITNSLALDGQSTMTAPIKASNGTSGAPSITFGSDTDLGLFRDSANTLGITASGGVKINGSPAAWSLLIADTFTAVADVSIVLTDFTGYGSIRFLFMDVKTSADTNLAFFTSTNGGVSYDTGASDYSYVIHTLAVDTGLVTINSDAANNGIVLTFSTNGVNDNTSFETTLWSPSTAKYKLIRTAGTTLFDGVLADFHGSGARLAAADVDAVKFAPLSGTFSGIYAVYGI